MKTKRMIPIFFATDDNYAPYLAVALRSMIDHACSDALYRVHILTGSMTEENERRLREFCSEKVHITVDRIRELPRRIMQRLHVRDYYSIATYYRMFIAGLYPQYDKVLYIDCDVMLRDDIAKLYRINIGDNILGAVVDDAVCGVKEFTEYTEAVIGTPCGRYFNAGVLSMNLAAFRRYHIESRFIRMSGEVQYRVAQDQDYLNKLCCGKVYYLPQDWNRTASDDFTHRMPRRDRLVHFKLGYKPWHSEGVMYGEEFWQVAKRTAYYEDIVKARQSYTEADARRDAEGMKRLMELCVSETETYRTRQEDTCTKLRTARRVHA